MEKGEKLRKEFQEWVEKGVWQGEDEFTKNFAVGNVADWWIEKIIKLESSITREKVISLLNTYTVKAPDNSYVATFTPEQFMSLLDE